MAKKDNKWVDCPYYSGYLNKMPQEVRDEIKDNNPKLYSLLFDK